MNLIKFGFLFLVISSSLMAKETEIVVTSGTCLSTNPVPESVEVSFKMSPIHRDLIIKGGLPKFKFTLGIQMFIKDPAVMLNPANTYEIWATSQGTENNAVLGLEARAQLPGSFFGEITYKIGLDKDGMETKENLICEAKSEKVIVDIPEIDDEDGDSSF